MIKLYSKFGDAVRDVVGAGEVRVMNAALNDGQCPLFNCGGTVHVDTAEEGSGMICGRCLTRFIAVPDDDYDSDDKNERKITMRRYQHAEAFCLMTYRSDDGAEEEIIWNSRDGVAPFTIRLRSGRPAMHVHWQRDLCVPDHVPAVGSRIFVDETPERQAERIKVSVAKWATDSTTRPMLIETFGDEESAIEQLTRAFEPGQPELIEVREAKVSP